MPVITVNGDAFAARVGVSLYHSLSHHPITSDIGQLLVFHSLKDLEDNCVRMLYKLCATSPPIIYPSSSVLSVLSLKLLQSDNSVYSESMKGFLSGYNNVYKLIHGIQSVYEANIIDKCHSNNHVYNKYNVILCE